MARTVQTTWPIIDNMVWGQFKAGDADPAAEKEYVRKSYLKKLDEYKKNYREAQNKADESKMHYYDERIKEVQKKLKELVS